MTVKKQHKEANKAGQKIHQVKRK